MPDLDLIIPTLANGLTTGAIYALVALGLSLIYGVLHIINFAHGSLLMLAMYGVYFLSARLGIDPYVAIPIMTGAMFCFGYVLHRGILSFANQDKDETILLATLGVAIIIDNFATYAWRSDTRIVDTPYAFGLIEYGPLVVSMPKLVALAAAIIIATALWAFMRWTDLGRMIRAVAKEPVGARLVGINVKHVYAMSFGLGVACLGAAACLIMPVFYVSPQVGHAYLLVAFTIVVLGGMGSFMGALLGGLIIGVIEALGSFFLGESLGQIGIFVIFILVLLFRPTGLFGQRA